MAYYVGFDTYRDGDNKEVNNNVNAIVRMIVVVVCMIDNAAAEAERQED